MRQQHNSTFIAGFVLLIAVSLVLSVPADVAPAQASEFQNPQASASAAVAWLYETRQNDDGGFGLDFITQEPESNIPSSLDATLAISALGYSPAVSSSDTGKSVIDYLQTNGTDLVDFAATDGGSNGKAILALFAAREDARDFAGHDYVVQLNDQFDPATGSYANTTAFNQGLAIAALSAVGEPVPPIALEWLDVLQAEDGSWEDGFGTAHNPDATAMAIMGLLAGGRQVSDASVADALDFLRNSQLESGGWEYGASFGENANSTAVVMQALAAAGEDFSNSDGAWARNGISPLQALLSWQSETGAFQADFGQGKSDDFFATAQSVPGVLGKPYPFRTFLQLMPYISGD